MQGRRESATAWIEFAATELRLARRVLVSYESGFAPHVCFHCQQAVEKALKGVLLLLGMPLQRTHDLSALARSLVPEYPELAARVPDLDWLTVFAVQTRYPSGTGLETTREQAERALSAAEAIVRWCRTKVEAGAG